MRGHWPSFLLEHLSKATRFFSRLRSFFVGRAVLAGSLISPPSRQWWDYLCVGIIQHIRCFSDKETFDFANPRTSVIGAQSGGNSRASQTCDQPVDPLQGDVEQLNFGVGLHDGLVTSQGMFKPGDLQPQHAELRLHPSFA